MNAAARSVSTLTRNPLVGLAVATLALIVAGVTLYAPDKAFLAVCGAIAFWIFLRYPMAGLILTAILLLLLGPAGTMGALAAGIPITAAKVCGLATFIAWLANFLIRRQPFRIGWEIVLILAFLAWSVLGVLLSPTRAEQLPEWVRLVTLVAFFVMAVHIIDSPARARMFAIVLLGCGLVMSAYAVAQYFVPSLQLQTETALEELGAGANGAFLDPDSLAGAPAIRVSGRAGHSNWLAMTLLVIIPLNAYWFVIMKSAKGRVIVGAAVLLELLALLLTFTRTGLMVGIIMLALLAARRLIRVNPNRIIAAAVALLIGWVLLPAPYKERVLSFGQYTTSQSVIYRTQLQKAAIDFTLENPILGLGTGGFGLRLIKTNSPVAQIMSLMADSVNWNPVFFGVHNMYLHVACEAGVIGLALLVAFFAVLLRHLYSTRMLLRKNGASDLAALAAALEVSLWSFLVCGVLLHALQQKIWWMIAALVVALSANQIGVAQPTRASQSADTAEDKVTA
jgi:O-antigen ligase